MTSSIYLALQNFTKHNQHLLQNLLFQSWRLRHYAEYKPENIIIDSGFQWLMGYIEEK